MSSSKSARKLKSDGVTSGVSGSLRTCATCHRDISGEVYVKCAKCIGFDQCMECFSVGNEAQNHLRTHPYMVMEPHPEPLLREGWSAEEEILLLHGIQVCGFGNWHEIANIIKTKSALECETQYIQTYIKSPSAPMPPDEMLPELVLPPPPPFDTTPTESRPLYDPDNPSRGNGIATPGEYAGYMPRRKEFQTEYLEVAEQLVSGIVFNDEEETEDSLNIKLQKLKEYNEILEERRIRTNFVIDWDLHRHEFHGFGATTPSEQMIEDQLLPLAQAVPRDMLTNFIQSIEREIRMRESVETLEKWRRNGILTQDEGHWFNAYEQFKDDEKLTPALIEKYNRDIQHHVESPEFRASLDKQLLSESEQQFCSSIGVIPQTYLRMKDLIVREAMVRERMNREVASSLCPRMGEQMGQAYDFLRVTGVLA